MEKNEIESAILDIFEASLEAQLKAVRRLRAAPEDRQKPARKEGMSQMGMIVDILQRASRPLHVSQIIEQVEKVHHVKLERESIVSALVKKVHSNGRVIRTDKNTFALKGEG
jgi:hypothetical protein